MRVPGTSAKLKRRIACLIRVNVTSPCYLPQRHLVEPDLVSVRPAPIPSLDIIIFLFLLEKHHSNLTGILGVAVASYSGVVLRNVRERATHRPIDFVSLDIFC